MNILPVMSKDWGRANISKAISLQLIACGTEQCNGLIDTPAMFLPSAYFHDIIHIPQTFLICIYINTRAGTEPGVRLGDF